MPKGSKNANGDRIWLIIMQDLCFEKTLIKCRVQLKGFVCLFLVVWKTFHNSAVLKTWRKDVLKGLPLVQRSSVSDCWKGSAQGSKRYRKKVRSVLGIIAMVQFKLLTIRNLQLEVWNSSFQFNVCSDTIVNVLVFLHYMVINLI